MTSSVIVVYSGKLKPEKSPGYFLRVSNYIISLEKTTMQITKAELRDIGKLRIALLNSFGLRNASILRKVLAQSDGDVLVFGLPSAANLLFVSRSLLSGRKVVVDVCDSWLKLAYLGRGENPIARECKIVLLKLVYFLLRSRVERYVFISEGDAQSERAVLQSVSSKVVPNGIPRWTEGKIYPPNPLSKTLLLVGSGDYPPNIDCLSRGINGFREALLSGDIEILVVGSNWNYEPFPGVHYEGWVSNLENVYKSCKATLALMEIGAGISNKVLESLAVGRPVIASRRIAAQLRNVSGIIEFEPNNPHKALMAAETWKVDYTFAKKYSKIWDENCTRFFLDD